LLLEELVFIVLLIVGAVIVAILAIFLFSPACLIVLAGVLTTFVFYEVYRKVNRRLSTCKVTCR
jgi:predicted PurR-regulated permease PerM